jgi:sporulation protein YlmC with PRC-barrel domain
MLLKKTRLISRKLQKLEGVKRASNYFDKSVLSKSGEYVGKVKDVIFKKETYTGLLVKGKRRLFIGKEFISSDTKDHIILNMEPVTNIIGKKVYDSTGKKIGYVKNIVRKSKTNAYSEILVKKAVYRRAFSIPKKEVEIAKKSIILKNPYEPDKKRKLK